MATGTLARPLQGAFLLRSMQHLYRRRLTRRGRFLLAATFGLAFVGVDTRRALVFVLFALCAPPLLLALRLLFRGRPAVRLSGRVPLRLTAGRSVTAPVDVVPDAGARGTLCVFWGAPLPASAGLEVDPVEAFVEAEGRPVRVRLTFRPRNRGRYVLPSLGVA
ncbi:MAG TPA: hypothetical protein VLL75_06460, partial [Vicinamibacteria bacterium]|nr:hypothetical protein [Vicinamibacteria bacterium]